jgi:ankyrin repeat protein
MHPTRACFVTPMTKKKKKKKKKKSLLPQLKNGRKTRTDGVAAGIPYPLHHAAKDGNLETMRGLIQDVGTFNPNQVNADGLTALHVATQHGQAAAVRYLLEHGKLDPAFPGPRGVTAFHLAAEKGHLSTVRELINSPTTQLHHVNQASEHGYTAVYLAALHGHDDVLRCLVVRAVPV